jgi:hypothetical protein
MPLVLFEIVKGMVTGSAPKTADLRTVTEKELRSQLKGSAGSEAR